jgi:hypothetical protein
MQMTEHEQKPIPQEYLGKTEKELRSIVDFAFEEAVNSEKPFEILGYLKVISDALRAGKLTVDSVGLGMDVIIKTANRAYHGSSPEASAIHSIASNIISSFPRSGK